MSAKTDPKNFVVILLSLMVLGGTVAAERTIYVDDDKPAEFDNIQAAIDDANDGDIVIVKRGVYTGDGNRDIDFKGKAITVRSTDPNDEDTVASTIIDCNGTEEESHRGFYFHSNESRNSVLEGLTIINGVDGTGAGILCISGASPTIRNNIIRNNRILYDSDGGAGIACFYGASPLIQNNEIRDNHCEPGGGGGGIRCYEAGSPVIKNNTISRNSASQGGGICVDFCSPTISNCTFHANMTAGMGGGILIHGDPTIANCIFSANSAHQGAGMYHYRGNTALTNCSFTGNSAKYSGGAIFSTRDSHLTLRSCLFAGNRAGNMGGAIYSHGYSGPSKSILINCTFAGNLAPNGNALACDSYLQMYPSILVAANTILWDGGAEIWNNDGSTITIKHSDINGGWPGGGNVDTDPCFADPGHWDPNGTPNDANDDLWIDGNYHLREDSPCIDAGMNTPQTGLPEIDIEGNRLPMDGDEDGTAIVDMGAYELAGGAVIYVDAVNGNDDSDGYSEASAFATIQKAVDMASPHDIVLLTNGTYRGAGNRRIDVYDKPLFLRSINGPGECIIDCENVDYGFYFHKCGDFVLEGLTIMNGYAHSGPGVAGAGGAVNCFRGAMKMINCVITHCRSDHAGGGVYSGGSEIVGCVISDCSTGLGGGGGICCCPPAPTRILGCTIVNNTATHEGGAVFAWAHDIEIRDCDINRNTAPTGGGIYISEGSNAIEGCQVVANVARKSGGGIYVRLASQTVQNCLLVGNMAGEGGGAIKTKDTDLQIDYCTIAGNTGTPGSGICTEGGGPVSISNSIVWGNRPVQEPQIVGIGDLSVDIAYTDVEAGWEGLGNIDADPLFVKAGYWNNNGTDDDLSDDLWIDGDYHLKSQAGRWNANPPSAGTWVQDDVTSPCLDAGNMSDPIGYEPFPNGGVINMGAYGGTAQASKSYFGKPVCETVIAGDINGDCRVDFLDFTFMSFHWLTDNNP